MFKLNEKGAVLSGVFYGILLLFLFLVLGSIIVLGNGRKALRQAKDNAINELNSKNILVDKVVLDSTNTSGGSYQTNNVDKNLLDINVSITTGKVTILVTLYNNTANTYTFSGIKYHNFLEEELNNYPLLSLYKKNTDIVINESSLSSKIDEEIAPYSYLEVPLEFIYNPDVTPTTDNIRTFILFKVKENIITGSNIKTVTFNSGVTNLKVGSQEYLVDTTVGELPMITREGYKLLGWYNSSGTKVTSSTIVTDNANLTAKWGVNPYENGTIVYFNVTTGTKCTNYTEAQSNSGVNSGCMKWYVFNDDGSETINLILDHNTTEEVVWNSSGRTTSGPSEILTLLKYDTSAWQGTLTPTNYSIKQSNKSYTIDYTGYKARLITMGEIAKITGNTSWNENTSSTIFYFDSNEQTESKTCNSENISGCKYGWLYDRTANVCKRFGCLNNSDVEDSAYWTASSDPSSTMDAWIVDVDGSFAGGAVNEEFAGIRPVITIDRNLIK